jgi:L-amino acid N-acyltransferase YncA
MATLASVGDQHMNLKIRAFHKDDWKSVSTIYEHGLQTRNATFETEIPEYENWIKKFNPELLWVATLSDIIVGWAGLQPISVRKVYEGVVEVTIYIHKDFAGKGIGSALMTHLINESEKAGIWSLYSSIFPENTASIHLHISSGFREIGYREKIGKLDGKWRNTVLFERRSKKVGN